MKNVNFALPAWYEVDPHDPAALHRLGGCFETGDGVPRSVELACECYVEALAGGDHPSGLRLLELMCAGYQPGGETARWLAEDQGPYARAARLACFLRSGQGTDEELKTLLEPLKEILHPEGLHQLGRLSLSGQPPRNEPLAFECLVAAAGGGSSGALALLALELFSGRWGGERAQAVPLLMRAAKKGDPEAAYYYAQCLEEGIGAEGNPAEAVHWLTVAAQGGFAPACFALAWNYDRGIGVGANSFEAVRWYGKGAELGHPPSMYALAMAHLTGEGCSHSEELAVHWLERAAEKGSTPAMLRLAERETWGAKQDGRPERPEKAFGWLKQAARLGDPEAMARLADCYEVGAGCQQDPVLAQVWLLRSRGEVR